jgi:hypothetical protein
MDAIEVYKTRKEELVELTLNLLPTALAGDRANRTFFFKIDEETGELTVDYLYYAGQISLSDNCFLTIKDYETPSPSEYGFETIEEMDFQACGYDEFIEQAIEGKICFLEME